jgi:hypothetical protein
VMPSPIPSVSAYDATNAPRSGAPVTRPSGYPMTACPAKPSHSQDAAAATNEPASREKHRWESGSIFRQLETSGSSHVTPTARRRMPTKLHAAMRRATRPHARHVQPANNHGVDSATRAGPSDTHRDAIPIGTMMIASKVAPDGRRIHRMMRPSSPGGYRCTDVSTGWE